MNLESETASKVQSRSAVNLHYIIDAHNRIVELGPDWDRIALANDASAIRSHYISRRPLYEFFADARLRYIYESLIDSVRQSGTTRCIPFRCDAPDRRRYMELDIKPLAQQHIRFDSRLIREEPRSTVRLLEPGAERSANLLVICSWCKKVKMDDNQWAEVEEAIVKLELFAEPRLPALSHGICDGCYAGLRRELSAGNWL